VTGKVLVMPVGKGSSSASSILLESVRLGTAPAAILLAEPDAILALGSAVARELYGESPPVVVLDSDRYRRIKPGQWLETEAGTSEVLARPAPPASEA
jgi:predicted aconitase with swiveling domain